MSSSYKDILISKYEKFSIEEHQEKKKLLKFEVHNILQAQENLDSQDYYIWGLTYYFTEEDREYNIKQALSQFEYSVQLDSKNYLAQLYLAHCYQDLKQYSIALENYLKVDQTNLKQFQLWRFVKLIEQIGFCQHKMGKLSQAMESFNKVLIWYKKQPKEELAVPSELISVLPKDNEIVIQIKQIEDYLE